MSIKLHPVVRQALEFTETYKRYRDEHPAIREAMCLKTQYPGLMGPIQPGDVFAGGQAEDRITYFGVMWFAMLPSRQGPGKQGGYCFDFSARDRYQDSSADRKAIGELEDFWSRECTPAVMRANWDEDLVEYVMARPAVVGGGCGWLVAPDLDRLVQRGIPGLIADVERRIERAHDGNEPDEFLRGLRMALDTLVDVCRHYEAQAKELMASTGDVEERCRLQTIAESLSGIVDHAPENLHEAMQLVWLYVLMTNAKHPELWRPDVAFGDLYVQDIEQGRLTEDEALGLVMGLWRQIRLHGDPAVSRMVICGKGRRNEENADRFALAAMEATRRRREVIPQLTLRFYDGQNPSLMSKALDVLGEGCIFPMLYNDDAIIPGVAKALNVSLKDAERYHPAGCGEYMLAGCSPSLLNCAMSVPKALDAALRNGFNSEGARVGPQTGDAASFTCYEDLWDAFGKQVDYGLEHAARIHAVNDRTYPEVCSFLFGSLLTDDCLERGRPLLDGGVLHQGACVMGHGFTNTADSLMAIKRLVFGQSAYTIAEVLAALDADFVGYEELHKALADCPKFGNDDDDVDPILAETWRRISQASARAGARHGMGFLTVSSVNPGGYHMGTQCGATADGRRCGMPFAIGHAPTAGQDKRGITAFLNSVTKADPACGGLATNVKISRDYFARSRNKLEAMFAAFFANGGQQASVTVVNQEDLAAAMREPEKYPHVLVRVGGWSARFIDLTREVQEDILQRTAY